MIRFQKDHTIAWTLQVNISEQKHSDMYYFDIFFGVSRETNWGSAGTKVAGGYQQAGS